MQVEGILYKVFPVVEKTGPKGTFKSQLFILEHVENPLYPNYITFQLSQEKCGILDKYICGQRLSVDFNLKGVKYIKEDEERFFNNLDAWRISPLEGAQEAAPVSTAKNNLGIEDETDDLPF